ncbi:MAG: type I-E CRISPR-associated protein Cse2/CasB [Bacteroidetes bacterium]|nr:type I-E CRISPR-associated protein Cse2/CasB [Bacteroidota bacterium]
MINKNKRKESYSFYVTELSKLGQRASNGYGPAKASLARLKRTLSHENAATIALRETGMWIDSEVSDRDLSIMLLLAGLFALNPCHDVGKSMGAALRQLKTKIMIRINSQETPSLDLRFQALLNSDFEDLPFRIRQLMIQLGDEGIGLDYYMLLEDFVAWEGISKEVQFKWAKDYYIINEKSEFNI